MAKKEISKKKPQKDHSNFFIGYKSVPDPTRRFLLLSAPLLLAGGGAIGAFLAGSQAKPDRAIWGKREIPIRGILVEKPYPYLLMKNNYAANGYDTVFLVEFGKHGSHKMVKNMNGKYIEATGKLITRHDRVNSLLEATSARVIRSHTSFERPRENFLDLGQRTLRGRIVDSKCYFGVMKPANGLTHKACASLCVRGGIPPFFVPHGSEADRIILVTDEQGNAAPKKFLPHIQDLIDVTGQVVAMDNHYQLRLSPDTIKTLISVPC